MGDGLIQLEPRRNWRVGGSRRNKPRSRRDEGEVKRRRRTHEISRLKRGLDVIWREGLVREAVWVEVGGERSVRQGGSVKSDKSCKGTKS